MATRSRRNPVEPRLSRQSNVRQLFWVVIGAIVLYVVLDAIAQSLPPHYSPVRDAESDLAVGPYGYIMAINFLNRGALSLIFLYALSKITRANGGLESMGVGRSFRIGVYVFAVWAVGAILLAFFPTDVPATPVSWHGAIHLVVAALAFFGGAFGALLLSLQFGKNRALQGAKRLARLIAILSVVLLLVGLVSIAGPIGGLTERMFLGSVLLWVAVVAIYLARWTPETGEVAGQLGGPRG